MLHLTVPKAKFFSQKHAANLTEVLHTLGFLHTGMYSETPGQVTI